MTLIMINNNYCIMCVKRFLLKLWSVSSRSSVGTDPPLSLTGQTASQSGNQSASPLSDGTNKKITYLHDVHVVLTLVRQTLVLCVYMIV